MEVVEKEAERVEVAKEQLVREVAKEQVVREVTREVAVTEEEGKEDEVKAVEGKVEGKVEVETVEVKEEEEMGWREA